MTKETPKDRRERKNKEYKYAVYRTACNIVTTIFAVLGFIISVLIFLKVY